MLLPSFAVLTLVLGLKTISDGVVIQQGSRRQPRAIEFRQIQGMVSVNGVGMLLAGVTGTLPTMANSSYSLSLINLTGVAARRVGVGVAVVTVSLALFSKFTAVLLTIPGPVLGAYLMLAMGMLFVSGCQTVLRDGIDARRTLVVATASAMGLGLHGHPLARDLFGDELGDLLGNGVTIGAIAAIGMTLLVEAMSARRARLEVTLDTASIPVIDEFLVRLAAKLGWNEASTLRLRSAGEETLASLLSQGGDARGRRRGDEPPPDRRGPAAGHDGGTGVRRHHPPGQHRGSAGVPHRRGRGAVGRRPLAAASALPRVGGAPPEVPRRGHSHGPDRGHRLTTRTGGGYLRENGG